MPTERQIAANRRNAQKSSGPRTTAGKKRSSRNAYRHGLSSRERSFAAKEVEQLAFQLAGDDQSPMALEWARTAAEAEFALDRVRRLRTVLIDEIISQGGSRADGPLSSPKHARLFVRRLRGRHMKPANVLPKTGLAQSAERLLPQLRLLARYEQREWRRRERALRALSSRSETA